MCDFHARSAEQNWEDAKRADIRAILISARAADSKDREENGRSSG